MWPNPQEPGDLVKFTEEILNGKLHFLCSVSAFLFPTVRSTFENKVLSILVLNIVGVPSSSADCYYKYWRFKSWFHQIYRQLPQNSCKFLVTKWLGIAVGCVGLKRKVVIRILVGYFWSAIFANMNTSSWISEIISAKELTTKHFQ